MFWKRRQEGIKKYSSRIWILEPYADVPMRGDIVTFDLKYNFHMNKCRYYEYNIIIIKNMTS